MDCRHDVIVVIHGSHHRQKRTERFALDFKMVVSFFFRENLPVTEHHDFVSDPDEPLDVVDLRFGGITENSNMPPGGVAVIE